MTENSIANNATGHQLSFPYVYGENVSAVYPEVSVSIERITPEVAKKMLETNLKNRDMRDRTIVKTAIKNNEWMLNGATIVFDENGILRDGQHRLSSCISVGMPIDTIVVRGLKGGSQETMDVNSRRVLRDYIKMRGYPNYSYVSTIGFVLYVADNHGLSACFMQRRGGKATIKTLLNYIEDNYESRIEPIVKDVRSVQGKFKGVATNILGALFDAFRNAGEDNYQVFVSQLLNKSRACVSVQLLQEKLMTNATETDRLKQLTDK
ncbi:MAG: hypothetical protein IJ092_04210, partial [Atopobiaceae bacterium]|nr:hypothetical protein [Atopobiaceae bacterium]